MNEKFILKIRKFAVLVVIVLFIMGVVYSIINYIVDLFKKTEPITTEQISEYIKDDNLVTDYNTFFTLEAILEKLLDEFVVVEGAIVADKDVNSEIYEILQEDYQKLYNKEELYNMIVKFTTSNFTPKTDDDFLYTPNMLDKVYRMDDYYILEFKNFDNEPIYIIIDLLEGEGQYRFILLEEQGGK